jgi:hypothetical protein
MTHPQDRRPLQTRGCALRKQGRVSLLCLAWCFSWLVPVLAQDDEVVVEAPVPGLEQNVNFMVSDENFDIYVFGSRGTTASNKKRLELLLKLQIESVEKICDLSDFQKKKLSLAGVADIKHFFEKVTALRKKFDIAKTDQVKFQQFWQDAQPVAMEFNRGTFGDGSYFRKALNHILNTDQLHKVDDADRGRQRFGYRAKVEMVVVNLDEVLAFRAEQRRKLVELMLSPPNLPRTFGTESYGVYAVLFRASQIPKERLAEFLEPAQLSAMQRVLAVARGYEQFLVQAGYSWDGNQPPVKGKPDDLAVPIEAIEADQ